MQLRRMTVANLVAASRNNTAVFEVLEILADVRKQKPSNLILSFTKVSFGRRDHIGILYNFLRKASRSTKAANLALLSADL